MGNGCQPDDRVLTSSPFISVVTAFFIFSQNLGAVQVQARVGLSSPSLSLEFNIFKLSRRSEK
jgi:hypothetical protein